MDPLYNFLLDFFPLTDEVAAENAVLGMALQQTALEAMLERRNLGRRLEQLQVLLALCRDLGYTSHEVAQYLDQQLQRIPRR